MFERFTDRLLKVMDLSGQNARRYKHELVGPEHFLLGLLQEGHGVGIAVLMNLKVDLEVLRSETEKRMKFGQYDVSIGKLPYSIVISRKVLENAIDACRRLGDRDVGTQHMLLGLIREGKSIAAEVLNQFEVTDEKVCAEIRNLTGDNAQNEDMLKDTYAKACMHLTDRSRKAMALAHQEAQRFNSEYIRPEHMLLGLLKEGSGTAVIILQNLGVGIKKLRLDAEKLLNRGPDMVTTGTLPESPLAKKVIEHAIEKSYSLSHNYVGTEHILLGLLAEKETFAAKVLLENGATDEKVHAVIRNLT